MNKETETLNQAIKAFEVEAGYKIEVLGREMGIEVAGRRVEIDALVELQGQTRTRFNVEVKNWVAQAHIGALVNQMMKLPEPRLLVADYVNRKLAQRLKERGIQFIDTAGNAYLKNEGIYVNVRGNERKLNLVVEDQSTVHPLEDENYKYQAIPDDLEFRKAKPPVLGRAFTAAGLKVVYVFLTDFQAIEAPYRYIAEKAEVALGTIGWVLNDLKERGLIFEKGGKRRLADYERLLELWAEAYVGNLRPKLQLIEIYQDDPKWWRKFDIKKVGGRWGGETAAAIITENLTPITATIYLRGEVGELVRAARLHRKKNATNMRVEVLTPFWPRALDEEGGTVNKLLVYADLINTADPRNIETAHLLGRHLS